MRRDVVEKAYAQVLKHGEAYVRMYLDEDGEVQFTVLEPKQLSELAPKRILQDPEG